MAIIIVLLIPADLKIKGWIMEYSPRDFILALTSGCILATLFESLEEIEHKYAIKW